LIRGLIGAGTVVDELRQGLDASAVRSREIANRVANASNSNAASFESALDGAMSAEAVDLEVEMVALADEQIRYEALAESLQKLYGQIRASVRSV
jgi:flagellar basal body rod protein FlgB